MRTLSTYLVTVLMSLTVYNCTVSKHKKGNEVPVEKTSDAMHAPKTDASDSLFFSMHRTSCYGRCPAYKVRIFQSGYTEYEGIVFVEKEGNYQTRMEAEDLEAILDRALEIGYFDLQDTYNGNITDIPSCTTSLHAKGQKKKIFNRYGGPASLDEFQKMVDQLLDSKTWKQAQDTDRQKQDH